jgi:hypothetical protein
VDDSDVTKSDRLDQSLHNFVVRDRSVGFRCPGVGISVSSSGLIVRPP